MSIEETASFWAGYTQLAEERRTGTIQPPAPLPASPNRLPISRIKLMPHVFQPRVEGDEYDSEKHIETLMRAIMDASRNSLDPVLVWWSGKRWILIDGHHRVQAHNKLRAKGKGPTTIDVKAFKGSLREAHDQSIILNTKNKLNVSLEDKHTKAWHLVMVGTDRSCREVASLCKVGKSSVSRMNTRKEQLIEVYGDDWLMRVEGMTWLEVMNLEKEIDPDEDASERRVKEFAKRLRKAFGKQASKHPEEFAKAIEMFSPPLSKSLEEWFRYHPDGDDFGHDDF